MNRILFECDEIVDGRVSFSDGRAEHVLNVLHGAVGQTLKTGEVNGLIGTSVITEIRDLHERAEGSPQRGSGLLSGTVVVACSHAEKAPEPWFDLILAPPRPRVLKRLLPQITALGVRNIVLVGAEKVEKSFWGAQLLKEPIYRPLLVEGLMQCGTTRVPTIRCARNFREYVRNDLDADTVGFEKFVAHPGERVRRWKGVEKRRWEGEGVRKPTPRPTSTILAVGPEGGWTDEEVAMLEKRGFQRYSLGSRILRTDTATIAFIAQLMAAANI